MKISFSLQKSLFEKVDDLARELQISRSRLFVLAVEDFIRRHENRRLLKDLNAACDDAPDPEEQALRQNMRSQHRQMVKSVSPNSALAQPERPRRLVSKPGRILVWGSRA